MKLFVIVLCLLSERYLVHATSYYRASWFSRYTHLISQRLPEVGFFSSPSIALLLIILPLLLLSALLLGLFGHLLLGSVGLILNLLIFYYCLGPNNPFYPVVMDEESSDERTLVGDYFVNVNTQLFSVCFWYILTGPLGILLYRLLDSLRNNRALQPTVNRLLGYMDWVGARLTVLLYLLVGNFQQGLSYYLKMFLSSPDNNEDLLKTTGLLALQTQENSAPSLTGAEQLVEYAVIVFLVLLAICTLAAWL